MANYALLGTIAFDVLHSPTHFDERHSAEFVQHEVLEGKPRLQAMGLGLVELNLEIKLHHLGAVESRYQALLAAKDSQEALSLVFGFSQFKGHFVITEISSQLLFTDDKGNALARDVSLKLKEFVGNPQNSQLGSTIQLGKNSPLASFIPKGVINALNKTKTLITKGIQVYRQAQQTINTVRQTVQVVRMLAKDPLNALQMLPGAISQLGGALGGLGEMVGLGNSFNLLTQGIQGAADFMRDIGEIASDLNTVQTLFKSGLNDTQIPATESGWFETGVKALEAASEVSDRLAISSAKLTAWIAIRSDEVGERE